MLVFILRFIRIVLLEGPVVMLSVYILSNTKLDKRKIMITGLSLGLLIFVVRLLPIHMGVHTILLAIYIILVATYYIKMNIFKAVASTILFIVVLLISEGISMMLFDSLFKIETREFYSDNIIGILIMIPSLIIALLLAILFNFIRKRLRKGI